ncbi:MAG: transglutaminase family protein [Acidimicrobiia bacterium]|nr:transglutaminase family protein [Acidimicrobiia bacterium]
MTWRIDVKHTTGYRYTGQVVASFNEARLTPQSTAEQVTIGARVEVDPPARLYRYWDYWGTLVHAFDLHVPHVELEVTASSTVETGTAPAVGDAGPMAWSDLDRPGVVDRFYEYLVPSRAVVADDELRAVAADLRAAESPAAAVHDVMEWVEGQLVYEQGRTTVSTSALEAWRTGRGVCQDFVHLSLALLRSMGIPARYVSGYLHPDPDAEAGAVVLGQSHAWAEAWLGEWGAFDPTNGAPVAHRHVLVGRGRDYHDVAPLKGIYTGAPAATPTVTVELAREA